MRLKRKIHNDYYPYIYMSIIFWNSVFNVTSLGAINNQLINRFSKFYFEIEF